MCASWWLGSVMSGHLTRRGSSETRNPWRSGTSMSTRFRSWPGPIVYGPYQRWIVSVVAGVARSRGAAPLGRLLAVARLLGTRLRLGDALGRPGLAVVGGDGARMPRAERHDVAARPAGADRGEDGPAGDRDAAPGRGA